eukprot:TRINITY_DN6619_c0_g1_i1.p1 TRINITY_DN6619_c0_g1~~TRINITY_DN6619_c0_g1_i1.p1  ORF type:complete len:544 (-),score=149.81 TRINITY_DN6619_c0_g1_i1:176-1807(-)
MTKEMSGTLDPQAVDDVTLGLQLQQFLDEWHYRVLHSGLAMSMDPSESVGKALDLLALQGLDLSSDEKSLYAEMDEESLVPELVTRMPENMRRTFEHFSLQLQLMISGATRVRHALEEATPEEVAKVMEDSDVGIGQQVLKHAVISASAEIGQLSGSHTGWTQTMDQRARRLYGCAGESAQAKADYEELQQILAAYPDDQNNKTRAVLVTLCAEVEQALASACFKAWVSYHRIYFWEKDLHANFRKQIEDKKVELLQVKAANRGGMQATFLRKALMTEDELVAQLLRAWRGVVEYRLEGEQAAAKKVELQDRLKNFSVEQQKKSVAIMSSLVAGNDATLTARVFQGLVANVASEKLEKAKQAQLDRLQTKLLDYQRKHSQNALKVLSQLVSASSAALTAMTFKAWAAGMSELRRQQEYDHSAAGMDMQWDDLTSRQKTCAYNMAERTNRVQDLNLLSILYYGWSAEVMYSKTVHYYTSKMDGKKHQLQQVHNMFQCFREQLEQGIGATPRRPEREGSRGPPQGSRESGSRPPRHESRQDRPDW